MKGNNVYDISVVSFRLDRGQEHHQGTTGSRVWEWNHQCQRVGECDRTPTDHKAAVCTLARHGCRAARLPGWSADGCTGILLGTSPRPPTGNALGAGVRRRAI